MRFTRRNYSRSDCGHILRWLHQAEYGGVFRGGTVDDGEALEKALVREIYEETSIDPVVGKLLYVHQFSFKETEQLEFFFQIVNAADYVSVDLERTSHGGAEIYEIDYVDPAVITVLPKFLSITSVKRQLRPEAPVAFQSYL